MAKDDLTRFRRKFDEIDETLLRLLNERQAISQTVGQYKSANGLALFDPSREIEIMDRLEKLNDGPLSSEALQHIYREIFSASRAVQGVLRVGYLGPEASFSHEAALNQFGRSVNLLAQDTIQEVFRGVDRDRLDYGVVPVENSSQGGVGQTLDLFLEYDLSVCLEIRLRIHHHLLGKAADLAQVKRVYSHPQVFPQCSGWLAKNLPGLPLLEASSTSAAARLAAQEDGTAAIASVLAAEIYGLEFLARAIEDAEENVTRFLVLSRKPGRRTGRDRTSLILTVSDTPGALFSLLKPFAERGINLTKIESRPEKTEAWKYVFFVDIEGHVDDEPIRQTLEEARRYTQRLKVLGSYPRVD